jgi:hypothetical protein
LLAIWGDGCTTTTHSFQLRVLLTVLFPCGRVNRHVACSLQGFALEDEGGNLTEVWIVMTYRKDQRERMPGNSVLKALALPPKRSADCREFCTQHTPCLPRCDRYARSDSQEDNILHLPRTLAYSIQSALASVILEYPKKPSRTILIFGIPLRLYRLSYTYFTHIRRNTERIISW